MIMQNAHILIVDDDEFNLELLSLVLTGQGYEVTTLNNSKLALTKAKSDSPDLILLDVNMPEMSGYEVCSQIKKCEEVKDIPVIFITALDDVLDKLEAFSVGCVDYINKPFALVEVLARVESQLNIRQLQSQLQQKAKSLEIENEFLQNRVCDRLGFDHELYKDLRVAQAQNQLQLYYQPIINFDTGEILSFEALLRWIHPVHGIISPTDFIPLAESTGLIIPIGFWVIEQAIAQLSNWNQLFPEYANLSITVNVSGYQLQDDSLFRHTQNALQASNVDPQKLKLEITESVLMTDPDTAIKVLNRFKQLGVQLYIDDFGTGYSTLSRLYDFPVDVLKIDRSFVNDGQWTMIEAITNLAKTLGKDIIIEGIETIEQLTILKNIGCHKGQGYYFSKPLDAVKTTNTLKRTLAIKTPEIFGVLV